jgi:hypothetical protein
MCHLGSELVLLSELQGVGISGSDITGTIPTELGLLKKLTRLASLSLYSDLLSGTIPVEACALEVSCLKACAGLDSFELSCKGLSS